MSVYSQTHPVIRVVQTHKEVMCVIAIVATHQMEEHVMVSTCNLMGNVILVGTNPSIT